MWKAGSPESDMGTAMMAKTKFDNNNNAGVVAPLSKEMIKTSVPLHKPLMSNRVKGHPRCQATIDSKLELSYLFHWFYWNILSFFQCL